MILKQKLCGLNVIAFKTKVDFFSISRNILITKHQEPDPGSVGAHVASGVASSRRGVYLKI